MVGLPSSTAGEGDGVGLPSSTAGEVGWWSYPVVQQGRGGVTQ